MHLMHLELSNLPKGTFCGNTKYHMQVMGAAGEKGGKPTVILLPLLS